MPLESVSIRKSLLFSKTTPLLAQLKICSFNKQTKICPPEYPINSNKFIVETALAVENICKHICLVMRFNKENR